MATHFSAVGQIRQFAGEAAADIRELRRFLKKEKALKLICLSLIVVCWGLKIVYDDIFIDSEIMSLEPYALLQSWYGSRRFSLIFTKKIFHMIISQRRTNLIGHFHRQTPGTVLKQILLPVFYHLQR